MNKTTEKIMRKWERAGATSSLVTREAEAKYWYDALTSSDSGGKVQATLPAGWKLDKAINVSGYSTASYAFKQCTWFTWNRARDFGITYSPSMGNGADWQNDTAYTVTTTPTLHSAVSFRAGQSVGGAWTANAKYGHVAFVEAIHSDGSVLISQSGTGFSTVYTFQVLSKGQASQYHYVIGK